MLQCSQKVNVIKGVMSIHSETTHRNITRIILFMPVNLQELIVDWGSSIGELPYFPVDNAHPVFSVLTNFFNRYRAPENTWNRTTGCG
jgi:hypothetical protein